MNDEISDLQGCHLPLKSSPAMKQILMHIGAISFFLY